MLRLAHDFACTSHDVLATVKAVDLERLNTFGLITAGELLLHSVDFESAMRISHRVCRRQLVRVLLHPLTLDFTANSIPGHRCAILVNRHVDWLPILAQNGVSICIEQLLHF